MKRYNRSRQRERILQIIERSDRHLSAEEIYEEARRDYPKISLGTVYRNLSVLAELGRIQRLQFAGDIDRFDRKTDEHYHFLCDRCGEIYDLPIPVDPELNERVNQVSQHRADRHQIEFIGVCAACTPSRDK